MHIIKVGDEIETRAQEMHRLKCERAGIWEVRKIRDYWDACDQDLYRKKAKLELGMDS